MVISAGATVVWRGPIDLTTVAGLRSDIDGAVAATSVGDTLVIDLGAVEFVDSLALGLLVHARNGCLTRGTALIVQGMPDRARRLVAMSGLAGLFAFDDAQPAPLQLPSGTQVPAAADPVFDQIAALVRRVIDVPTALVSLVDSTQQVFPGAAGLPEPWQHDRCTPLSHSFCQYVVADESPLVITDAREDPLLAHNLAVPELGVVAYAGMPITDIDGHVVGSLCAIDSSAREWTEPELTNLADLAAACSAELQKRGATQRAAIVLERDRIAHDMHQHVVTNLFTATLALGQALSISEGRASDLVSQAVNIIDDSIASIRDDIFNRNEPHPKPS